MSIVSYIIVIEYSAFIGKLRSVFAKRVLSQGQIPIISQLRVEKAKRGANAYVLGSICDRYV